MAKYSELEKIIWCVLLATLSLFASSKVIGLQPDAALYAGLSYKVFVSGEFWALSGTAGKFPLFFEHPPYFFQWGSTLFSWFGVNESTAKLSGALPSWLAVLSLLFFTFKTWGSTVALLTVFVIATTGHFTKYAATSMMEGPLALGVLLASLGTYLALSSKHSAKRLAGYLLAALGVLLASAFKGVVGWGALGGVILAFVANVFIENKSLGRLLFVPLLGLFLTFMAAAPFLFWLLQTLNRPELFEWIQGYFLKQVFPSATTDRGEVFFEEAQNYFYYLQVIVRNVWPWWWAVPLSIFWIIKDKALAMSQEWRLWALVSFSMFFAFFIPLSLISYKLPHYLHPTYLPLAPLASFTILEIWKRKVPAGYAKYFGPYTRWGALLLAFLIVWSPSGKISSSSNRGQEFFRASEELSSLDLQCKVLVHQDEMDAYRMEAFALWYWRGRSWERVDRYYPSKIALPAKSVFWRPQTGVLWISEECRL